MARFYHSPQQVVLYSFTHVHMFVDLWLDFLLLNTQGLADLSGSQHFPPLFDIYSSSNFKYYFMVCYFHCSSTAFVTTQKSHHGYLPPPPPHFPSVCLCEKVP